ncbi:MAG: glycosyltransferase family 39 protein, partial [Patescibacteria group bacterium]
MNILTHRQKINRAYDILFNPLFFVILGFVLLFIVSFKTPVGNDEGMWGYIGRIWVENQQPPYIGAVENKTPGIMILYAASYAFFGVNVWFPRLLAAISTVISALLIYQLTLKMANCRAAIFAMAIFVLLMISPYLNGSSAEVETFMNLFIISAFYVVFTSSENNRYRCWWMILSGFWWGIAIIFRQTAILSIVPLALLSVATTRIKIRSIAVNAAWLGVGALLANMISILPLIFSGATIIDYINGAWLILLRGNIVVNSILSRVSGFYRNFFTPDIYLIFLGVVSFVLLRKKIGTIKSFVGSSIAIWILSDFIVYNIQGQYFPHHNKVLLLSWSIAFGVVFDFIISRLSISKLADNNTGNKVAGTDT